MAVIPARRLAGGALKMLQRASRRGNGMPMTKLPALILVVSAPLAALAAGCGSDPQPPANVASDVAPPPVAKTAAPPAPKQDTAKPTSGSIRIDDKILKACGDLPTARFAFDSTAIEGEAAGALDALARCFVSGPLKGKGMKLIGHADPGGDGVQPGPRSEARRQRRGVPRQEGPRAGPHRDLVEGRVRGDRHGRRGLGTRPEGRHPACGLGAAPRAALGELEEGHGRASRRERGPRPQTPLNGAARAEP